MTSDWRILHADVIDGLATLADASVDLCVTSPPYWNLRRYGAGKQELGSEKTAEEYLAAQVAVFHEVRKALKATGVLVCNIGDTYAGSGKWQNADGSRSWAGDKQETSRGTTTGGIAVNDGDLPAGNRVGIPERLALALQEDGWLWRDTVVWDKPNPMPESVAGWEWRQHMVKVRGALRGVGKGKMNSDEAFRLTQGFNIRWDAAHDRPQSDRAGKEFMPSAIWEPCPGCATCAPNDGLVLHNGSWRTTRSHECCYVFSKQMGYWANQEAVKEKTTSDKVPGSSWADGGTMHIGQNQKSDGTKYAASSRNPRSVQRWSPEPLGKIAPYSAPVDVQHYASFPAALPDFFIRAYCPERVCSECGAPWAPVVESAPTGKTQEDGRRLGYRRRRSRIYSSQRRREWAGRHASHGEQNTR